VRLSESRNKETVIIKKVLGHGSFRKRITEMWCVKGKEVTVIKIPHLMIQSNINYMSPHFFWRIKSKWFQSCYRNLFLIWLSFYQSAYYFMACWGFSK